MSRGFWIGLIIVVLLVAFVALTISLGISVLNPTPKPQPKADLVEKYKAEDELLHRMRFGPRRISGHYSLQPRRLNVDQFQLPREIFLLPQDGDFQYSIYH